MKILRLALIVTTIVAACGWPPYDIDASSALWSAREMELIAEFAIPRGTGIVEPWSNPEISFFPSIRFEPEGTSEQLGLFLFDFGSDFSRGQFFDAVRETAGGAVASGTPWLYTNTFTGEQDSFGLRTATRRYFQQTRYAFSGGAGDVFLAFLAWEPDYDLVTIYAEPVENSPTLGAVRGTDSIFWRQINAISNDPNGWFSVDLSEVTPVALGSYFHDTANQTFAMTLFIDDQSIRLVETAIDIDAPENRGVNFDDDPVLRDDLDAPAPLYTADFSVGRLAVRDIESLTDSTRIAVSLPEADSTHAVFLGTSDGTSLRYTRVPDLTDPVIEVLSTGGLFTDTDNGYRIVDADGTEIWRINTPTLLFTGEREHDGDMYLYFTSGYWARDGGTTTRYTRIYRLRTPR